MRPPAAYSAYFAKKTGQDVERKSNCSDCSSVSCRCCHRLLGLVTANILAQIDVLMDLVLIVVYTGGFGQGSGRVRCF